MSSSLLERLGLGADTIALIISCDELGFCQSANAATYELLRDVHATSSSLMVPAPWARSASADYRGEDVGVNLTIISELDRYRWGPITQAPSLLDGDGAFPRTVDDVWEHADLDELRREWRAQIERAVLWGFQVTHLITHVDGVETRPEFFDVYLDLAEDFHLPIRLLSGEEEDRVGFPFRELAAERNVVMPDSSIHLGELGTTPGELVARVSDLHPGVYEVVCRVSKDSEELRAATPAWQERVDAYTLLRSMSWKNAAVELTNYRSLSRLMQPPFGSDQ